MVASLAGRVVPTITALARSSSHREIWVFAAAVPEPRADSDTGGRQRPPEGYEIGRVDVFMRLRRRL